MKRVLLAVLALSITSAAVYGAGDLLRTPGSLVNQTAIQQCAPKSGVYKAIGNGAKGSFANYTTTNVSCLEVVGTTATGAVPVPVAVKYRYGGFSTGKETDFMVLSTYGGRIWPGLGVTKIGFMPYSTATTPTTAYIVGGKM
jgi:hypothetical protein